ncbi:MAG: TonB-dependent receptor plug domain-containing protein [Acidobacteriota bacterium]
MVRSSLVISILLSTRAFASPVHATIVDGETLQPVAHATANLGEVTAHGMLVVDLDHPTDVSVAAPGYEPTTQTLSPDDADTLVLLFKTGETHDVIEVHAHAPRAATDTSYLLTADEIRGLPGASNDALAAVRGMPGVGSAPAVAAGRLVIRGGAPQDSLLEIDGVPVPFVYHAFDNTTILPVSMIGSISYSPGGFGVEEGRATSGTVGIETTDDVPAQPTAQGSLSLLDAQTTAAVPLGHGVTLSGGLRRSTVDLLIPLAMPQSVMIGFTTPPRYYDGQLALEWRATARDRVRLLALTSYDRLGIVNEMPDSDLPADFSSDSKFGRLIASWKHEDGIVRNRFVAALGDGAVHAKYDAIEHVDATDTLALVRDDLAVAPAHALRLRAGAFGQLQHTDVDALSVLVPADGLPPGHFHDLPVAQIKTGVDAPYAAAYAAADVLPAPSTTLTGGVRVDYFGHLRQAVVEPRVELAQRAGALTLRAAAGRYARDLSQLEGIPPGLDPELATQLSAGGDLELGDGITATATGYHTARRHLAVVDAASTDMLPFASTGSGSSYGADLMLRVRRERAFGWLAYSFARSDRRDTPDGELHRTPFDQTHVVTAVGSYRTGAWQLGGRVQYATGLPYTEVVGASYSDELGRYVPQLGPAYAARYPATVQLDLRIEHAWQTRHARIAAFVDVMNVFRDAAVERYTYSEDFSKRSALTQFVPLPSIGIRGEI